MIYLPKLLIYLAILLTYTSDLLGAQEILILGEEISPKNKSSFLNVLEVSHRDRSKSVADFLTHEKGVRIMSQSGHGSLATANIRGIGAGKAEQILILLDGVRLNTAQGSGVDLSRIPLSIVKKIEILRGGESALYGTDAVGGVINLVTTQEETRPSFILSKQSLSTSDYTFQTSLSQSLSPITFYGSFLSKKDPGDFFFINPLTQETQSMQNNAFFSRGFFGKALYSITPQSTLSLTQEWHRAKKQVPGSLSWPSNDHQKDLRSLSILTYHHLFENDDTLSIVLPLRFNTLRYEDSFGLSLHTNYYLGPKVSLQFPLGQSHLFQTVGELSWDSLKSTYMDLSPQKRTYAIAIKDDFYLNPKTTLTCATRAEYAPSIYTTWVPKVGLSYAWSPTTNVKANISNSFRAPSFDERYVNFPTFKGNPELQPETSWDGDLGFSTERNGFKIENAFFMSSLKNLITQRSVSPSLMTLENRNQSFIWGREFSIDSVTPVWKSFYASFNHTWLKTDLPYRPTHIMNSSIIWQKNFYKLFLNHQWTSSQSTPDPSRPKLSSFQVIDFGSEYEIYKNLLFDIKVENLFNAAYERIAYYPMPGRTFTFQLTGTL